MKNRGIIYTLETGFNRVVPPWLFRLSIGDVFDLNIEQLCQLNAESAASDFSFKCVIEPDEREQLRSKTWNSVPVETTANDFGFAIINPESLSDFQGGVWGATESFIENNLGFRVLFENDQAWIYCAFIDKAVRGKGVYQRLLAFATTHLRCNDYQRLYVVVQPWNNASIHVHRKYSNHRVGRIIAVRFLRLACVFKRGQLIKDRTFTIAPESDPVRFKLP